MGERLGFEYEIKDLSLADEGLGKVNWAWRHMPVLQLIYNRFKETKPLKGLKIGVCLHITPETANLVKTLRAGGAEVILVGSTTRSTQDDVAAYLVANEGISVFAMSGISPEKHEEFVEKLISYKPEIIIDDGADILTRIIESHRGYANRVKGATEETTTGVMRIKHIEREGLLPFPVIAVNDAKTKIMFDNRYGTGQSVLDAIMRATNTLIAGKKVVVAGYGWCGKGIAARARGMGGIVIVTEVNPIKALEAYMDGYLVMSMREAVKIGDIFITATGNIKVLTGKHFQEMKDGAIIANAGRFEMEVDVPALREIAISVNRVRPHLDEYILSNGKHLYLVAEGKIVNLIAAEGHPSSVMDMSFANQALAVEYIAKNHRKLPKRLLKLPEALDEEVAKLKLLAMGVTLEILTEEQREFLKNWY